MIRAKYESSIPTVWDKKIFQDFILYIAGLGFHIEIKKEMFNPLPDDKF